jgi:hypothetical protein
VEQETLGLYVIRGDNMCAPSSISLSRKSRTRLTHGVMHLWTRRALIGAIDEAADGQVDLDAVRAEPLKPVVH